MRFTIHDFLTMAETGAFADLKPELVHGKPERLDLPFVNHSACLSRLLFQLQHVTERDSARVVLCGIGIDFGANTVLGCDAVLAKRISDDRWLRPDEINLAAEVVSSTTLSRDMGLKRREYARAGIANYWVVDLDRRLLHRFAEPTDGEYLALAPLRFGESVPVPGVDATITID